MRPWGAGGLLLALTLALAGCSHEEATPSPAPPVATPAPAPSPTEAEAKLVPAAVRALARARSVHLTGTLTANTGITRLSLRLFSGGECEGEVRGAAVDYGRVELRLTPVGAYLKGDATFWASQAGSQGLRVTKVVNDRWVAVPETYLGSYPQLCSLPNLVEKLRAMERDLPPALAPSELRGSAGSTWTFSTEDEKLVLRGTPPRIVLIERNGAYSLNFSKFHQGSRPVPPPTENVVPLSALQRRD